MFLASTLGKAKIGQVQKTVVRYWRIQGVRGYDYKNESSRHEG
jgi:hypothetical protein